MSFQKVYYSLVSYFFVSFQFLSPGKEVSFCWWFVGPIFPQTCWLLLNWYALWGSLWASVFLFFQQKSWFSLSFIGIESLFAPTRKTSASVCDIESMNSFADTRWIFPKPLLAFIYPDYRSWISKKGWNFFYFRKKIFLRKKELLRNHSSTLMNGW